MNHKLIKISLLLITLSTLIPIVFLSFFNYPAADDFSYGVNPQGLGFIEKNIDRYFNWTSRYFATSVLISSPIVFGSTSYFWIYPLLFIALFYFSIFRLLKSIGIDSFSNNLLTLSLMSVYTLVIPSLTENFYWLAGSVTYFLPSIALLVLIASTLNILNHKKNIDIILLFLSIFIIGGSVEILVGFTAMYLFGINLYYFFIHKKIHNTLFLALVFIGLLIFFIVISPGNQSREDVIKVNLTLTEVVIFSLKKIFTIVIRYLAIAFVLFLTIQKLFNIKPLVNSKVKSIYLLGTMAFLIFIGSFITIYSLNHLPPPRVENVLVFTGLIFMFLISNQLYHRFNFKNSILYPLTALAFIIQFSIPLSVFYEKSNLPLMYSDIFSARVFKYNQEIKERENLLKNCESDCVVPKIKNKPMSIFYKDLSENPKHFINTSQAEFFQLNSIKVLE